MQCYSLTHSTLLGQRPPTPPSHSESNKRLWIWRASLNLLHAIWAVITAKPAALAPHFKTRRMTPVQKKIFMFLYWSKIPDVYSDAFTKQSPVQKSHTIHLDRFWLHFAYWWSSSIYKVLYIRKLWIWPGCPLIISEKVAFHFSSILQH